MKKINCIFCATHLDNRKDFECSAKRHKFSISDKQAKKYDWAIDYIKSEVVRGRHIIASLGSAGYTFLDDIEMLANYALGGRNDRKFYELLTPSPKQNKG